MAEARKSAPGDGIQGSDARPPSRANLKPWWSRHRVVLSVAVGARGFCEATRLHKLVEIGGVSPPRDSPCDLTSKAPMGASANKWNEADHRLAGKRDQ